MINQIKTLDYKLDVDGINNPIINEVTLDTNSQVKNNIQDDLGENSDNVPISREKKEIQKLIIENDTCIVIGHTGSGKTTRLPEIIDEVLGEGKKIMITQPRKIAATSVSKYVSELMGTKLGDKVGYQVRFDDMTSKGTDINFATDGILLTKFKTDPLLLEYDCVVVDEAHERSLNIDLLLGLLKLTQKNRKEQGLKELKVVVTSATIEKEKFMNYFSDSPSIEVPGRLYPIDINYLERPTNNIYKESANIVNEICDNEDKGDILIFMPGQEEIKKTIDEINSSLFDSGIKSEDEYEILPLHGSLNPEDQNKIFNKSSKRKIIVSTNIAETSLTVPGIKFVVDSGLIKQTDFNPTTGISFLHNVEHSQAGCNQRSGRCGRTGPGTCFRLYTQDEFNEREAFGKPEIQRTSLGSVILNMKSLGIDDIENFDFIDPPSRESIIEGLEYLKRLKALDHDGKITELGKKLSRIPLEPHLGIILLESIKYEATEEVATIMSFMGARSPFARPKDNERLADVEHKKFKDEDSDFITLLNVWKEYEDNNHSKAWCFDNFINQKVLKEVGDIRSQLFSVLRNMNIYPGGKEAKKEAIMKSILSGMIDNIMIVPERSFEYTNILNSDNQNIFIHPSSTLFRGNNSLVMYGKILDTKKKYASNCQKITESDINDFLSDLVEKVENSLPYSDYSNGMLVKTTYTFKNGISVSYKNKATNEQIGTAFIKEFYRDISYAYGKTRDFVNKLALLYRKSNKNPKFLLDEEKFVTIIKEKVKGKEIESLNDLVKLSRDIELVDFTDLSIIDEEVKQIESGSPDFISLNGREYKIDYIINNGTRLGVGYKIDDGETIGIIEADSGVYGINEQDLPKLESGIQILFKVGYTTTSLYDAKTILSDKEVEENLVTYNNKYSKELSESEAINYPYSELSYHNIGINPLTGEDLKAYPCFFRSNSYQHDYTLKFTYDENLAISYNKSIKNLKLKLELKEKLSRLYNTANKYDLITDEYYNLEREVNIISGTGDFEYITDKFEEFFNNINKKIVEITGKEIKVKKVVEEEVMSVDSNSPFAVLKGFKVEPKKEKAALSKKNVCDNVVNINHKSENKVTDANEENKLSDESLKQLLGKYAKR